MAAWLVQAVQQVARMLGSRALGGAGRRALVGGAVGSLATTVGIPGIDLFPDGDGGGPRRRRRRRALTASDRADIAFVEAVLGKSAGKSVAMLIVSRTTA